MYVSCRILPTAACIVAVAMASVAAPAAKRATSPSFLGKPAFLYFEDLLEPRTTALWLALLDEDEWRTERLMTARGLSLIEPLPDGRYLMHDGAFRTFIYSPRERAANVIDRERGVQLVGMSADRRLLVFSFPRMLGVELRVFNVDTGWRPAPLAMLDRLGQRGTVGSGTPPYGLASVAVSPGLVRYAFFTMRIPSPLTGGGYDLCVAELPLGWPRAIVAGVRCENSGISSMTPNPLLLWVDDNRILYQHAVPVAEPSGGEPMISGERLQQTLRLVDVATGRELLALPVPGWLGASHRLWRAWPGGEIHYAGATDAGEYVVNLEASRLIPITEVASFYRKGLRVRVGTPLVDERQEYRTCIWDRRADQAVTPLGRDHREVLPSPDGRFAAFTARKTLSVYDRESRKTARVASGTIWLKSWVQ